jgi:uncharacterized RDD family membrane protein YckC
MFCPRCGTWNPEGKLHCKLCGEGLQPGVAAIDPALLVAHDFAVHARNVPVYGGFWRRAAALIIDSLVMFFPLATLRVLLGLDMMNDWKVDSSEWWISAWTELVLSWLYGALLIAGPARGTLGMQVMDLHVTGLQGERVSFARATARYMAQFLSVFALMVGYVMQVFTRRRQTLHDLVSSTVVVRTRGEREPTPVPAWGSGR